MGGKTSAASKNKYNAKAYDRITIVVPKGRKGAIQTLAVVQEQSVNAYITQAIDERMVRDNAESDTMGWRG
ncbi:hypothetical protein FACS1894208_11700 [Clostridia bacterium]|nr:hypothetical protein FACS1894208_11700 [Clostridia bacterium]